MTLPDVLTGDRWHAFCRDTHAAIAGANAGPLAGCTFAAKDAFDIRGHKTGAGNPDWLRTHPPAAETAAAVEQLLDAGATLVGKTHTDELTFSLNGENQHYGTPINPRAPQRIPGGSSSGSAVAVAGGAVDFALGTDCGGSVRAPASFCGIYGMRPTHGRISTAGVFRLAPSFDTVGWFARNGRLLAQVGRVLLDDIQPAEQPTRLLIAADAFDWAVPAATAALLPAVKRLANIIGHTERVVVAPAGLDRWFDAFRTLQGAEIWAELGGWIRREQPALAPDIQARFEWTSTISPTAVTSALPVREETTAALARLLADGAVLCLPTTPDVAPLLAVQGEELITFRRRALSLLAIAGLARLPQINLPVGEIDGSPIGLSIIAAQGRDTMLLKLATQLEP